MRPALLALALALGCAPESGVDFRVVIVGDDPLLGADAIEVRVRDEGGSLVALDVLPPTERTIALGPLPFGQPLTVEVETRLGELPLALGRSFPFEVPGPGAPASSTADVTLGLLGRHAPIATSPSAGTTVRLVPSAAGAWIVTDASITHLLAHGETGRPVLEAPRALPPERLGAAAVPLAAGVLLVGGAEPGATWLGGAGTALTASDPLLTAARGVALAVVGDEALVIGGEASDGTLLGDVSRVRVERGGLIVEALEPLPAARAGAQAVAFLATSSGGPVARVLVEGGRDAGGDALDLVVIDPAGRSGPVAWTSARPRRSQAIAALTAGQVMLAGGIDASGTVVSDVDVLVVDVDRPLVLLAPEPDPLFRARAGAVAVPLATGLALVVGGTDSAGAPIEVTEIADMRLVPGRWRGTGGLPAPGTPTDAAMLGDGTVLVTSGTTASLYFPFPP